MSQWRQSAMAGLAMFLTVAMMGCGPYWADRGNDAKDMFEFGITVSAKPGFALFQDYFNYIPHGFSYVDGYILGSVNRQMGVMRFKDLSWGALLVGRETLAAGKLNPDDHHQLSTTYVSKLKAAGEPMPTDWPGWDTGLLGMKPDEPAPWTSFISCRRNAHLGFLGFHACLHPGDFLDFALGWTTLDIMGDDYNTQAAAKAAK